MSDKKQDICIIGGGLTGLTAAYALSKQGHAVKLVRPEQTNQDTRTTALLAHSIEFLKKFEIWDELTKDAFPLKTMRIVDGTNRLIRAQQADFHASEIDLDAFGYNIRNPNALDILEKKISHCENVQLIEDFVSELNYHENNYTIKTQNHKPFEASIIVGADGRNSIVAKFMNKDPRRWNYPQTALVLDFEHTISNQYTSTEFHRENGPFTIVPHSLHRAGLVWMETPEEIERLIKLPASDLAMEIERNMQSYLGNISIVSTVQSFPISGMVAQVFGQEKHILVGEAAHVFPPIGAQGFNLGIRDLETFIQLLEKNSEAKDIGSQYHNLRSSDINMRTMGVDALNRSLLSSLLPVQLFRAAGIYALTNLSPLRKFVMKLGIAPRSA